MGLYCHYLVYYYASPFSFSHLNEQMMLTLSSPVMPFGIILLILFFICYNFWGLERVNPSQPKKIQAYEGQN
jgi:hypothetical protein